MHLLVYFILINNVLNHMQLIIDVGGICQLFFFGSHDI